MKGIVFSLEVALAIVILVSFLIILSSMSFSPIYQETQYERFYHLSHDISQLLANTKIRDAENFSVVKEYLEQGIITQDDMDKSLLDVIGCLWAQNNLSYARKIVEGIMNYTLPKNLGYEVLINGTSISNNSVPKKEILSKSEFVISGYSIGKPVEGYMVRASLKTIKSKTTSVYAYFGGFIGQGNLTVLIKGIPSEANITSIKIEGSFGDNFTLYINGNYCKDFIKTPGKFSVDTWEVKDSVCLGNVSKGSDNFFGINFTSGDINKMYVAGGFIKVSYETSQMVEEISNSTNFYFPGVVGVINQYDSFYVPGNVSSMSLRLHFNSNYTIYLNIGNTTVFNFSGSNLPQTIEIDNSTLSSLLNYPQISLKTIPIRFGTEVWNLTGKVGNADVILITDVSGSMNNELNSSNTGIQRSDCSNPSIYWPNTSRISLAKCLDKEFVDIILSDPNNRVGLVTFSNNAYNRSNLTNDREALHSVINSFTASGSTCICCAIRMARLMLEDQSNETRQKFIIVMTDGTANMRCYQQDEDRTTCCSYGYWFWPNYFCPSPLCGRNTYYDPTCGDSVDDTAVANAIDDACKAKEYTNATIFSIGFGPVIDCSQANQTLIEIAECGNGSYYGSNDARQLEEIYHLIAQSILNASFIRQVINLTAVPNITLYPDSYISFNFTPEIPKYAYGEVSVKVETNPFEGCDGSFFVPSQFTVDEINVLSYSGDYWTINVSINNSEYSWKNIFNLTEFGINFTNLGDPYIIKFSPKYVKTNETNLINVTIGSSPINVSENCGDKNKVIYTARLRASTPYSDVFSKIQGKNVTVYYDKDYDGYPDGYSYVAVGKDLSNFNPNPITVDELNATEDGIDYAFLKLLEKVNFIVKPFNTGRPGSSSNPIDIEISPEIDIDSVFVSSVYTLWGPAVMEVRIWV